MIRAKDNAMNMDKNKLNKELGEYVYTQAIQFMPKLALERVHASMIKSIIHELSIMIYS